MNFGNFTFAIVKIQNISLFDWDPLCDARGNTWPESVRLQLSNSRILSDPHAHAAEARYHDRCRIYFLDEIKNESKT